MRRCSSNENPLFDTRLQYSQRKSHMFETSPGRSPGIICCMSTSRPNSLKIAPTWNNFPYLWIAAWHALIQLHASCFHHLYVVIIIIKIEDDLLASRSPYFWTVLTIIKYLIAARMWQLSHKHTHVRKWKEDRLVLRRARVGRSKLESSTGLISGQPVSCRVHACTCLKCMHECELCKCHALSSPSYRMDICQRS